MLVGAGKSVIELEGVLPHDGFASVHDTLHVRSVVFQNPDGSRACLVSVDATSLRDDTPLRAAAAEAAGCAEDAVWVVATHTFSSPHVRTPEHLAGDAERERNELFASRLVLAVATSCSQALRSLAPALLEAGTGPCSVNANRDVETPNGWWLGINRDGFSDRTVRVLRVVGAADGRTLATLFSVDVQSSVVQGMRDAEGGLLVSSDLAGWASEYVEGRLGGVAVFLVGAAGDQAPRVRGAGALPELASILATEAEVALSHATYLAATRLVLSSVEVTCPAQRRADFATLAPRKSYEFEQEGTTTTLVSLARLGTLVVAGLQPEVDSAFGARLRAAGGGSLEVLTMVNGAKKYLPSAEAYDRITYEAMNSGFARGADEVLERAILEQLG